MASKEKIGASGSMTLYEHWEESSSGHYEKSSKAELVVDVKGNIVLVQSCRESNQYASPSTSSSTEKTKISSEKLIQLIVENGKKVK